MRTKMTNPLKPAETYTHTHTHTDSFCRAKKFFLLIIATIFITQNIFGADILSNNPMCDTDTFGNGGSVDLEANFEPNEITVNFHGNGDDNNMDETKTCEYDGVLTLPTPPTRRGYTFAGWKLDKTSVIVKDLDTEIVPDEGFAYNWTGWGSLCLKLFPNSPAEALSCSEMLDLSGPGEWKAKFSYGTIYGEASCNNTTPGNNSPWNGAEYTLYDGNIKPGNTFSKNGSYDDTWSGRYCWCRLTGVSLENETKRRTIASSAWVFRFNCGGEQDCAKHCTLYCANGIISSSGYRDALYKGVSEIPGI